MNTEETVAAKLGVLAGKFLAWAIALVFALVITPWITLGSINRLFDIAIQHSFMNYVYFWAILIVLRMPRISYSRGDE